MKTLDRIIFLAIAIFLGILAGRALIGNPALAAREEIIKVDIVRIGGSSGTVYDLRQVLSIMRKDLNHTPTPKPF